MNSSPTTTVSAPRSRVSQRSDVEPWYRQFWPWFLIALPATAVVFSFATLYIALHGADEVIPHDGDSASYSAPRAPASAPVSLREAEARNRAGVELERP